MDALAYFSHLGNQSLPTQELTKTLSLQLTAPEQFTKHGQMMEVMLNLIYKRNKAIPKTACFSSFVQFATRLELNRTA